MALFVMIGWDGPNGLERRSLHRDQHVTHITTLRDQGTITFAGPIRDADNDKSIGAVIVIEAGDLATARGHVDRDPYVTGGVFETITVNPFKQVIPEPA